MAPLSRWFTATALLSLICAASCASAQHNPVKCQKAPLPLVRDLSELSIRFPGAGVTYGFFSQFDSPRSDTEHVSESARVAIDVGGAFPIHRHPPGAAESLFVLSGTGLHEVMVPGNATIDKQVMSRYKMYYAPGGSVHKITNTGDEPLDLLVFTPLSFCPFTVFGDWPASADAEGVDVTMPWEGSCPPGQELKEEL